VGHGMPCPPTMAWRSMVMGFAAIYVPEFMVQAVVRAEMRAESGTCRDATCVEAPLRGRAIALIDGKPPLWNVVTANVQAFNAGILLGMTKANAAQFAGVELRTRSLAAEKAAHAALRDVGWSVSPRLEETAADLLLLDISGLSSLLGSEKQIAELLLERAAQCGLRVNVAIAKNVLAAEVAARGFPGITLMAAGEEAQRIGCLPVGVLLPTPEIAETLSLWGIETCAALARLPVLQLSERLGQPGVRLGELARGKVSRALIIAEAQVFFEEEMELDDAVEELEPLSFVLGRLLSQLCARLAARALAASLLHIRCDLQPVFENALDIRTEVVRAKNPPGLYERSMQLPTPMRDAQLLLKLLRLRLQSNPPGAPIVKIIMTAEAANPRVTQHGLFLPSFPDVEKLELTLARLASVVGEGNVGSPEVLDTHRPGEFRMEHFLPDRGDAAVSRKKRARKSSAETATTNPSQTTAMSFRVFRPPLPMHVNAREGRPAEIYLQGRRAEVRQASGPWRTSGEWWREEQWVEDEWDLEVCFVDKNRRTQSPSLLQVAGPAGATGMLQTARYTQRKEPEHPPQEFGRYRIFFDVLRQGWFARGVYD
jgi:protein ImuB